MKFLIPTFTSPDSFADNVAVTLRRMGHEVATLRSLPNAWIESPIRRMGRTFLQKTAPSRLSAEERWAIRQARVLRPDFVLTLTQALREETLFELKRCGVGRCVAWWGDTPANMNGMGLLSDGWDAVFLKDHLAVEKFRRVGLNAHLLHEAMNPLWHRPIPDRPNESVAIIGSFYGYRQFLTRRLISAGVPVALYGGRLPSWVAPEIAERHTRRFVVREEKSRIFGSALACLNSTALSEGDSLNCRAFEIAGAGGLQLLEHRPAVIQCFEPAKELLVFHTFQELLHQLDWVRANPEGARAIREAGARRALAHHTYEHRLRHILNTVD